MSNSNQIDPSNNSPSGDGGRHVNMHYGANPILFKLAGELRAKTTEAEEVLWNIIKINEWHLKFRRQHPISNYIADFYCHNVKLVIELDGGYHENKEVKIYDEVRENDIKQYGITVLRFKNEEVFNNTDAVLSKIGLTIANIQNVVAKKVELLNNSPLAIRGGGKQKLFVIKIGGNIIDDENKLNSFLKDVAIIPALAQKEVSSNNSPLSSGDGGKCILVHGGGKIATKIGEQLGIKSTYINGRRITDEATIDLVTMVYGGLVNKKIVAKLQALQCNAIGLTGADANIIPATKRPIVYPPLVDGGGSIDYGFAGDINSAALSAKSLQLFLDNGLTPVIAPLTHDGNGQILNTNADTIASALAGALSKQYDVRLIYCFEKKGILENVEDEKSVVSLITKEKYQQLLKENKLFDGILPKIDNAFAAIDNGVAEVLIGDANDLLQNITEHHIGTLIK